MSYAQPVYGASYGHQPANGQPAYGQQQYGQQYGQQQQAPPGVDPTVASWFNSIDQNRSGSLDVKELLRALAMGNLNYSLTDVDQMIRAFDTKGSRTLTVVEFAKLHEFLTSITLSFNYFDTKRTGALQLDAVTQALRHAGFNMDPPVVQAMFKRHDPDNTNSLALDEYIRMCLFLQSCVRTFGAFDSQKAGRITLDFNQFVYAASHIA